jgi:hypothetical protein
MKSFFNHSTKFVLLVIVVLVPIAAKAQDPARLRLDRFNQLEERADEVIEVSVDGKLLDLAKNVLKKIDNKDAVKIAEAIAGLKGIYVKIFNFEKENEYTSTDYDDIRSQLQSPAWERMAGVRSKKKKQNIEVFTMFTGDRVSGVAVVISDAKTLGVVNVVGPIDIELLAELSGHLSIPKIEIERDNDKDKNGDDKKIKVTVKTETKKP